MAQAIERLFTGSLQPEELLQVLTLRVIIALTLRLEFDDRLFVARIFIANKVMLPKLDGVSIYPLSDSQ